MRWTGYYDAVGEDGPRPTLLSALKAWSGAPGFAIDLGCGSGRDTLALLAWGWRVLAVDGEPEALRRLEARTSERERLATEAVRFEEAALPPADLVNASFSLPFCSPKAFPRLWMEIRGAVKRGGLFAGHLFGERDGWRDRGVVTMTRAEIEELFSGFAFLRFEESDRDGVTAKGVAKHWHLYEIVARRED